MTIVQPRQVPVGIRRTTPAEPTCPEALFTFPLIAVDHVGGDELDDAHALAAIVEELLDVVVLTEGTDLVEPDTIRVGSITRQLFERQGQRVPATTMSTKAQARADGFQEAPGQLFDRRVVRRTEPRIDAIANILWIAGRLGMPKDVAPVTAADLESVFAALVSIVVDRATLESRGRPVETTGLVFARDRFDPHVTPTPLLAGSELYRRGEGLATAIAQVVSTCVVPEWVDGEIRRFRLRDLELWATNSERDPYEFLAPLTRNCNARCEFCYVHGNPSDSTVQLNRFSDETSYLEASVRLDFFRRGLRLPHPTYDLEEIMKHPRFFDVVERFRADRGDLLSLTTNGYLVDEACARRLKGLEPVEVTLSLNAVTPDVRRRVMGGRFSAGLRALENLDREKIRTTVSLVAWPTIEFDEMRRVIAYADQFDVRSINVILGGYTQWFPEPPTFTTLDFWSDTVQALQGMRTLIRHPLVIQPRLFEENLSFDTLGLSRVMGVSPQSAAEAAGVRIGDVIKAVNGTEVKTRPQCLSLLGLLRHTDVQEAWLSVERDGRQIEVRVAADGAGPDYRYGEPFNDRFGIQLLGSGVQLSSLREMYRKIEYHEARTVAVVTSRVVAPLLDQMIREWGPVLGRPDLRIEYMIPECGYYGGTIILGDLYTGSDILAAINRRRSEPKPPELVIVPSASFNYGGWWRDITGAPFDSLRRAATIPVELLVAEIFE